MGSFPRAHGCKAHGRRSKCSVKEGHPPCREDTCSSRRLPPQGLWAEMMLNSGDKVDILTGLERSSREQGLETGPA